MTKGVDTKTMVEKILQRLENILVRFDKWEKKSHAACKLLHDRHEKRMERLEVKVEMR